MNGLTDGQKTVQAIRDEIMKIDTLCSESQNMIKNFTSINLVSQAHRNFGAVETMVANLQTFNDRLNRVEAMLGEDEQDKENMPNLLRVHYELKQLRNIRDDTIEQIQRAENTSLESTLEGYFSKLGPRRHRQRDPIFRYRISAFNDREFVTISYTWKSSDEREDCRDRYRVENSNGRCTSTHPQSEIVSGIAPSITCATAV
jgi:hypothetical protein